MERWWSYAQVHALARESLGPSVQAWRPDVIMAIGCGGCITASILCTVHRVPVLCVSLEWPSKRQWLRKRDLRRLRGKRVLVVSALDDSRTTIAFCVSALRTDSAPSDVAVAVLHSKQKSKAVELPDDVSFFCGAFIPDLPCNYPWDAHDIDAHSDRAHHDALAPPGT